MKISRLEAKIAPKCHCHARFSIFDPISSPYTAPLTRRLQTLILRAVEANTLNLGLRARNAVNITVGSQY
jgi:hypothetical protein